MIRIDHNTDIVRRALARVAREIPAATARALNDTAFKVMKAERDEINAVFDQPKPWVAKNVRVFKATAQQLSATVGATDYFERAGMQSASGGNTAWDRILSPHVVGGSRLQKASELRLSNAGLLPRGWFTTPGKDAPRDAYGNIPPGEIVAILSWVGAMGQYAGDNQNKRDRQTKRKNKIEQEGTGYFVARVGNRQGLAPGIYRRKSPFPRKPRGVLLGRGITPVLMFVSRVNYQRRLDWYGVGERTVAAEFPRAFAAAYGRLGGS